jgi:hypothetical protein
VPATPRVAAVQGLGDRGFGPLRVRDRRSDDRCTPR